MANVRATSPASPISPMPTSATTPTVGDPTPLGLSGLALTLFLLGLVDVGVGMGGGGGKVVLSLAVAYGFLTMLLAGMWEFRAGNTLGATIFTSLAALWLSYVVWRTPGLFGLSSSVMTSQAEGIFMLCWAIVVAILAIASFRTTAALAATLVLLFLTLLLLGLGGVTRNTALVTVGGWLAILTALVAWYTALAALLRSVSRGAIMLPTYPLA